MKTLNLRLPSAIRLAGATRLLVRGNDIGQQGELGQLSDRCLEDIGLQRIGDRNPPRPFWMP